MTTRRRSASSWTADFMVAGTRYRETFATEVDAQDYEAGVKSALARGLPIPSPKRTGGSTGTTLKEVVDQVEIKHWQKFPRSYKKTMINVRLVTAALGPHTPVASINHTMIEEMVEGLMAGGNSGSTVNRKLAVLSTVLTYAAKHGMITFAPKLEYQKPGAPRVRVVSPAEEAEMLSLFARWSEPNMVDLTVLAIDTGLRLSELLRMEWTSVADDMRGWQVEEGKSKAAYRYVALSPRCRNALVALRQRHPEAVGPLTHMAERFEVKWRDLWDRMRRELRLDDVVIHTMRHTCATRLCAMCRGNADLTLIDVMKWMGHSNIAQTQRYVHPENDAMDRLMEAREAHKPTLKSVG